MPSSPTYRDQDTATGVRVALVLAVVPVLFVVAAGGLLAVVSHVGYISGSHCRPLAGCLLWLRDIPGSGVRYLGQGEATDHHNRPTGTRYLEAHSHAQ